LKNVVGCKKDRGPGGGKKGSTWGFAGGGRGKGKEKKPLKKFLCIPGTPKIQGGGQKRSRKKKIKQHEQQRIVPARRDGEFPKGLEKRGGKKKGNHREQN